MPTPQWLTDYFDDVDNRRLEPFVAHHARNVTMRFGNAPLMRGHDELREGITRLWSSIDGLQHNFMNIWRVDASTTVFEHSIDYTRKDGDVVNVPCTVIFVRSGDLISDIRSYIDLAPVFA